MKRIPILVVALLAAAAMVHARSPDDSRKFVQATLDQFSQRVIGLLDPVVPMEVISVDGFRVLREGEIGDRLFAWPVRKRSITADPEEIRSVRDLVVEIVRHSEAEALPQSAEGAVQFPVKCFYPECAFRVVRDGRPVFILISLSCRQIRISDAEGKEDYTWFSSARRSDIDSMLQHFGLPKCLKMQEE